MKHYGLDIAEGSEVTNLTAPTGTGFPTGPSNPPNAGELFFRTDLDGLYVHNGTDWSAIGSGGSSNGLTEVAVDTFTGTGSQTAFTLSETPNTENEILVYVGGVYQEQSTYSVSGTTLTFTTAPPNGVGVEVTILPTSITGNTLTNTQAIATAGQTSFSVTYTVGNIFVYLNGVKLLNGTDYTATNGTSVELTNAASALDELEFEVFGAFANSDFYTKTESDSTFKSPRRNKIINGEFKVLQRSDFGTTKSGVTSGFFIDRFTYDSDSGSIAYQLNHLTNTADLPDLFATAVELEITTAGSLSAAQWVSLRTKLEKNELFELDYSNSSAKTMVLSFWCKASVTGTYVVNIGNVGTLTSRGYAATFTVNDTNWNKYEVTITGDTAGGEPLKASTGSANYTPVGLDIYFILQAGSSYVGSNADTWVNQGSFADWASGQTVNNFTDTVNNKFAVTGVQLEVGTAATDFEVRSFDSELELCQRYYETLFCHAWSAVSGSSRSVVASTTYKVTKRANPTVTRTGNVITSSEAGTRIDAVSDTNTLGIYKLPADGSPSIIGGHFTADAEL